MPRRSGWAVRLDCPLCDDQGAEGELRATLEPGRSGSRDEPAYGPSVVDLEGCVHAAAFNNGSREGLSLADRVRIDKALDAAIAREAHEAYEDEMAAREEHLERRGEDD